MDLMILYNYKNIYVLYVFDPYTAKNDIKLKEYFNAPVSLKCYVIANKHAY